VRRRLAGLAPLVLLIAPLFRVEPRRHTMSLGGFAATELIDAHDKANVSRPERRTELPALTVHYFRGDGYYSEARFAVDLPSHPKKASEAPPGITRLFGRIRGLETNRRLAQRANDVVLEPGHWTATRADRSLHQSSAFLLPGRYWLQLFFENAGASVAIDRILEVPSFPNHELGISSLNAVSETKPSSTNTTAPLSLNVDPHFTRGQAFVVFAEAYPVASPEGSTAFSVRFVLSRGDHVVCDRTYDHLTGESKVALFQRFDTKSLEPGSYLLRASVYLSSGEEGTSSRLELTIVDASP